MNKGQRYLIKRKDSNRILEFKCLEVSEVAYKLINNTPDNAYKIFTSSLDGKELFWLLKSEVDKIGQTTFHILEELQNPPNSI